ncbi:MAG: serine hydrolase domain-containing protein [Mycobacteriales bacterium]
MAGDSGQRAPAGDSGQRAPAGDRDEAYARRLAHLTALEQATQRLASICVGIVKDGGLAYSAAAGATGLTGLEAPTPDTQYRIGSISKTFVAVCVLRLRDEGVLDLDDPIGSHLTELAELPVTVAQLLSHTSGLRAETPGPWWERTPGVEFAALAASSLRSADLLFRPGRRFHYSNPGYAILGELVSRKRSAQFGEVITEELLRPLGMHRTTLRPSPPWAQGLAVHPHAEAVLKEPEHDAKAMAPAGGLWSTLTDLSRWAQVLIGRRPEILGADSVVEMRDPVAWQDVPGEAWTAAYGLGLQLWNSGGKRQYGHSGSMPGFVAMLIADEASANVALALTNSTTGLRMTFCDQMLAELSQESVRWAPPRHASPSTDPRVLDLLGTWYWGPGQFRINVTADGCLDLRGIPAGRHGSFRPRGDGSYVGEWGYFAGETLQPCWRSDGSLSHLDIASFIFTRSPYDRSAGIPGGVDAGGWQPG